MTAQLQSPPRVKGELVFRQMDQQELDHAYTQINFAPNMQQLLARYAANSEAARKRLGEPRRIGYGTSAVEQLDLYAAPARLAPIFLFVHGGAWRTGEAKDYAFAAEMFVRANVHFAAVDFDNVVSTGGDLAPLAHQVRSVAAWVYTNAATLGADPRRIYLCGHSSGAHLAAAALTTDWAGTFGLPSDIIRGGVLISGMYDLHPVRLSARSDYVRFTDAVVEALSPQRHVRRLTCPILIAVGTQESPEFQRQARDFAAAAKAAGKSTEFLLGEGYNHFEILETLANPYGLLGRAALDLIGHHERR